MRAWSSDSISERIQLGSGLSQDETGTEFCASRLEFERTRSIARFLAGTTSRRANGPYSRYRRTNSPSSNRFMGGFFTMPVQPVPYERDRFLETSTRREWLNLAISAPGSTLVNPTGPTLSRIKFALFSITYKIAGIFRSPGVVLLNQKSPAVHRALHSSLLSEGARVFP
jgi:hypothetical protein